MLKMVVNCVYRSLALALLVSSSTASQFTNTSAACKFTFSLGDVPTFLLPEAGPNSPGDVQLNPGNNIITRGWDETDVNGTLHSCNGDSSAYYVGDDTWNTTYTSNDGDELEIDVFYATYQNQLWVRTLQPHMDPSLYDVLGETKIRLNITCGKGDDNGCIEFTAKFTDATPYNYTESFEFEDTCSHGFSSGVRAPVVQVHAASPIGPTSSETLGAGNTLILAGKADQGLPWSEGFNADGSRKDDEFWGEWWATVNSQYNATEVSDSSASSSDPCSAYGGMPDPGNSVCCHSDCDTCEDSSNHFQNDKVCSRSMMLSGYDYGTCGVDVLEAPCELPGYNYLGCYKDTGSERIMSMVERNGYMSTELCAELCAGSLQFGTQWSRECWCSPKNEEVEYDKHGEGNPCDHECFGSVNPAIEMCGGFWAMSVYEYTGAAITENALAENEETGCTSNLAQFWDARAGEWRSTFQTLDSESHNVDMFYLNLVDGMNELWVTEIESWMAPSLYNQLQYNYVRLSITCPDDNVATDSCVIFRPTFTNWSPEVDGAMAGFRFDDPALPTFDLPAAVPNSPGDVVLTTSNSVVTKTGAETETFCNGDSAEYYGEDGLWYKEFLKATGEAHELKHVFYPQQRNLYAATIQSVWEPNLRALLTNRIVRMRVWCTNDERAEYLFFRVSGETASCDDIDDLCTDVVEGGALQLIPTFSQCATALSATYLGWLSAGP